MNRKLIRYIGTLTLLLAISISTKAQNKVQPLVIADQGSFAIGGGGQKLPQLAALIWIVH